MRYQEQHGRTVTFAHVAKRPNGEEAELQFTCEYDAGDLSVGIWPGWFMTEAAIMGIMNPKTKLLTLTRDQFDELYGTKQRDRIEDYAGDLARDLADDARAEQQAARDEEDSYGD